MGRATPEYLIERSPPESIRAMGLQKWDVNEPDLTKYERAMLHRANTILGFS